MTPSYSMQHRMPILLGQPDIVKHGSDTSKTPGIPEHKKAVVALVTAGVEMDVLGFA